MLAAEYRTPRHGDIWTDPGHHLVTVIGDFSHPKSALDILLAKFGYSSAKLSAAGIEAALASAKPVSFRRVLARQTREGLEPGAFHEGGKGLPISGISFSWEQIDMLLVHQPTEC